MVRYCLTAAALKGFSVTPLTRKMYRNLGNVMGGKKRSRETMPDYYLERINRMLRIARAYGVPRDGSRIIELGTGWCHWEALTTRLFFQVEGILYDVWDNRQISGLKNYVGQLEKSLDKINVDDTQRDSARHMIGRIKAASNYDELYKLLGFEYVVDPAGKLDPIEKGKFDLVVSAGVLEHIYAKDAVDIVTGIGKLLKIGGYSVHSINIRDHLYLYDTSVSPKQYLQYSDRTWNLYFANQVQYINRIQRSEWLDLFKSAGLSLMEEVIEPEDVSELKIAEKFGSLGENDLRCGGLQLIHVKTASDLNKALT